MPATRWDTGRVVGALFASLIVCSLIAGGLGAIVFDRGPSGSEDGSVGENERPTDTDFERSLRNRIAAAPEDAEAMASLANLLATVGERDEAIDWYGRSLSVRPEDEATRLNFGTTLVEAGLPADAEVQFRRLLEQDDGSPEAAFYLAEVYRSWTPPRTEEAVDLYRLVIELAPDAYLADQARVELDRIDREAGAMGATPGARKPAEEAG